MALPTWVYTSLEKVNLQQQGDFTIPFTILIENGTVVNAFQVSSDSQSKDKQRSASQSQIFRHVYDCSPSLVQQGLGISDELIEMQQRNNKRSTQIVAMFCEKVAPQASYTRQKNSVVSVEYYTPQQALNLLHRGGSHVYPRSYDETAECLAVHLKETRQHPFDPPPIARSGVLQYFDADDDDYCTGLLFHWQRHQPTTLIIPETEDDKKRVTYHIEARRNRTRLDDRLAFPYFRCATVDGLKSLSEACPVLAEHEAKIKRAAEVVLRCINGEAQNVTSAVLMFRVSQRGRVQFLYAPFVQMKNDIQHPPLAFSIPAQYRHPGGGEARPKSDHIFEEDRITDPVMKYTYPPVATDDPSPHRRHGSNGDDSAQPPPSMSQCVRNLLDSSATAKEPKALRSMPSLTASPLGVDHAGHPSTYDVLSSFVATSFPDELPTYDSSNTDLNGSAPIGGGAKKIGKLTPLKHSHGVGQTSTRSAAKLERTLQDARREQERAENAAKRVLSMMKGDAPLHIEALEALHVPKRHLKLLVKYERDGTRSVRKAPKSIASRPFVLDCPSFSKRSLTPNEVELHRAGSMKPSVKHSIAPLQRRLPVVFVDSHERSLGGSQPLSGSAVHRRTQSMSPHTTSEKGNERCGKEELSSKDGGFDTEVRSRDESSGTGAPKDSSQNVNHHRPSPRESSQQHHALDNSNPPSRDISPRDEEKAPSPLLTSTVTQRIAQWDAQCKEQTIRPATIQEQLEFVLSQFTAAPRLSPTSPTVSESAVILEALKQMTRHASEFAEALTYHVGTLNVVTSANAISSAAAKLRVSAVQSLDQMAALFSFHLPLDAELAPEWLAERSTRSGEVVRQGMDGTDGVGNAASPPAQLAEVPTSMHHPTVESPASDADQEANDTPALPTVATPSERVGTAENTTQQAVTSLSVCKEDAPLLSTLEGWECIVAVYECTLQFLRGLPYFLEMNQADSVHMEMIGEVCELAQSRALGPYARLLFPEERFNRFATGCESSVVFGVALGAVPAMLEVERQVTTWTLHTLRHLFVELATSLMERMSDL